MKKRPRQPPPRAKRQRAPTEHRLSLQALFLIGLFALGCTSTGIWMLLQTDAQAGIPVEASLLAAEGYLRSFQTSGGGRSGRGSGLRFELSGKDTRFIIDCCGATLRRAYRDEKLIAIKYQQSTRAFTAHHEVWELSIDGQPVRTFGQSAALHADSRSWLPWIGAALLGFGVLLGYVWRKGLD